MSSGYTEKIVSAAVKRGISALGGDWWSLEAGYLIDTDPKTGENRPRKGGTRTTPGFPDILFHLRVPGGGGWLVGTVEVKGSGTSVDAAQWQYAQLAMERGLPHFIVRSVDEFFTGLYYMQLLPGKVGSWPTMVWDRSQWPQNMNYLKRQATCYWSCHECPDWVGMGIPKNRKKQPNG